MAVLIVWKIEESVIMLEALLKFCMEPLQENRQVTSRLRNCVHSLLVKMIIFLKQNIFAF